MLAAVRAHALADSATLYWVAVVLAADAGADDVVALALAVGAAFDIDNVRQYKCRRQCLSAAG